MNSIQIERYFKNDKDFRGAVCRDQLPIPNKTPIGFIANTDKCDKPGEHWIAIYIDKNGLAEYFDPFGLPPLHYDFIKYLNKHSKNGWKYNEVTLQSVSSDTCGYYCVLYLKMRMNNDRNFLKLFTNKSQINDILVKGYLKTLNQ